MQSEYRLVVCGSGGVGKSALTVQFISNHFIIEYDPTIEDAYRKQINLEGISCVLDILDTAGQDEYSALRDSYYRTGRGFCLIYSITSRQTFDNIAQFRDEILRTLDTDDASKVPLLLVGNKCDLETERQVTTSEARDLAKVLGCGAFLEVSAKTRKNVDEMFYELVRLIWKQEHSKENKKKTKDLKKKIKNCTFI